MKTGKLFFFLLILIFFTAGTADAQKVAVVLSGGGSRGAAHIGVLRALEQNGIPINFIAGTSIGAIVGGLYASGYSPDEIEKLMDSKDFMRWAAGKMKEDYVYYYRKEDPNSSWFSLDFNTKKKFTSFLPTNIISPFEMDFAFMEIFAQSNAACKSNFDSLMIPFRCMVADIDSSAAVTMAHGDLASAVRASMSIPFVFKPITINNKLVFDGGMYNNFPADVALRDFKPDVVIGSRVAARYSTIDKDDIISQLLVMLMGRQSDSICYKNSVLILPKIPDVNIISFDRTREVSDSGYAAALRKIPDIRKLVHDSVTQEQIISRREKFLKKFPEIVFDSVHISGLNPVQSKYILLTLKHGKKTAEIDDLRKDYFRIIDEGFVKSIYPSARFNPVTGFYDLYLDIQKAENFTIQAGGNLSIGANSEGFIELQYKNLWTRAVHIMANGYFGKVYSSLKLGGRIDFTSRSAWYLESYYTYNHYDFFANSVYFFDDETPSNVIQKEHFGEVLAGIPVTNKGRFCLSLIQSNTSSKYYPVNYFSSTDTADRTDFRFFNPSAVFELNNLNRKQYASAGAKFIVSAGYYNGNEKTVPGSMFEGRSSESGNRQWVSMKAVWDNYFANWGPVKFGFYTEGLISNQPLFGSYMASVLYAPVFQPIPDMQTQFISSFHANNYLAAGLKEVLRITKNLELRLETYLFQPYKEINEDPLTFKAYYGEPFSDRSFLGSATLVFHTFLGPFSLGMNYYDKATVPFSYSFNFGYLVFNRSSVR